MKKFLCAVICLALSLSLFCVTALGEEVGTAPTPLDESSSQDAPPPSSSEDPPAATSTEPEPEPEPPASTSTQPETPPAPASQTPPSSETPPQEPSSQTPSSSPSSRASSRESSEESSSSSPSSLEESSQLPSLPMTISSDMPISSAGEIPKKSSNVGKIVLWVIFGLIAAGVIGYLVYDWKNPRKRRYRRRRTYRIGGGYRARRRKSRYKL